MPFSAAILAQLRDLTEEDPPREEAWYGSWNMILTTLFPPPGIYTVHPQFPVTHAQGLLMPDFVVRVTENLNDPALRPTTRPVLIVELKPHNWWSGAGKDALMNQIDRQVDAAFENPLCGQRLYWIAVIGPQWKYGYKRDDGRPPRSLMDWSRTDDNASYA
jgi:hypothetical protein